MLQTRVRLRLISIRTTIDFKGCGGGLPLPSRQHDIYIATNEFHT